MAGGHEMAGLFVGAVANLSIRGHQHSILLSPGPFNVFNHEAFLRSSFMSSRNPEVVAYTSD